MKLPKIAILDHPGEGAENYLVYNGADFTIYAASVDYQEEWEEELNTMIERLTGLDSKATPHTICRITDPLEGLDYTHVIFGMKLIYARNGGIPPNEIAEAFEEMGKYLKDFIENDGYLPEDYWD